MPNKKFPFDMTDKIVIYIESIYILYAPSEIHVVADDQTRMIKFLIIIF